MTTQDFDAARQERLRLRDPVRFKLGGETFTCLPVIPVGAVLDLADAPEVAEDEAHGAKSLAAFIDGALIEDDRHRFRETLSNRREPIDAHALFEVAVWLAGEYAGRPFSRPAESSGGPRTTGEISSSEPAPTGSAPSAR